MDFQHLKGQLEERKQELEERLMATDRYGLDRGFASDMASGELSQYDNHPADSGTELYEREKDLALLGHVREELADIEYSFKQMEQGTYGICEVTGQRIPNERLEALPTARTIASASPNRDVSHDRPVEEDVLTRMEADYGIEDPNPDYNEQNAYDQVASFNQSGMTYDDSSLEDNMDGVGYVEQFEPFVSTDIHGYRGPDSVQFERNVQYDQYMDEQDHIEEDQTEEK